MTSRDPERSNS